MDNQIALSPQNSVVVEACAGSGKTWLLVSRIVRILLDGTPPSQILAITFTRKAAQEMRARLHLWLHQLATAADDQLVRDFFAERGLTDLSDAQISQARGLYRTVMLAQPGVTISTFHGWFMQVMQRAPLNAEVMQGMQLVERASALREEAWDEFIDQLRLQPQAATAQKMQWLFENCGLHNTQEILAAFVAKRAEWWAYTLPASSGVEFALADLQQTLAVDLTCDYAATWGENPASGTAVINFARQLATGTEVQQRNANTLEMAWTDLSAAARFAAIWPLLFTQKNEARAIKATAKQDAAAFGLARDELQTSLQAVQDALTEQHAWLLNEAVLHCGAALLAQYQKLKQQRQQMDFADLEWQVCRLLQHSEHALTMQYKLDSRYRQVLLDEFQDTNPLQWQIMRAWFDASVAVDRQPSVFLVGDPKQSIYRFRRADARLFGVAREYLIAYFGAKELKKNHTRRNSPDVLQVVNAVFVDHPNGFDDFAPHTAEHQDLRGHVVVLPLAVVPPKAAEETIAGELVLRNPLTTQRAETESGARHGEAEMFAEKLLEIVTTWQVIEDGKSRAARYGDIMVLVRNRTHLTTYEAALRDKNIPFLSSRRGGLLDTLEAQDLQTVLLFLITPFADLALAHTLRTPIFACDDDDLMQLAVYKIEGSEKPAWWRRLRHLATTGEASENLLRAHRLLENWLRFSDSLPVHDLLDRIYFEGEVVARYAAVSPAVLRAKVEANLHSFMEIALSVDAGRYPSLPRFLQNCRELRDSPDDAPNEGKLGVAGDAVRIYTVHESKGLEAPIVCLLDANSLNERSESYNVLLDWPSSAERPTHFSVFADLASRGKRRTDIFELDAQQQAREEMNLLYVAMTRAKQVLLVSGHGKDAASEAKKKSLSWYDRIKNVTQVEAINPLKRIAEIDFGNDKPANELATKPTLPPLIFAIGKRRAELTLAQQRGTWLHGLLQYLAPETAIPQHPVSVDQIELQQRLLIPADECEKLWQQAQFILAQPTLQRYFEPSQYRAAVNELAYINAAGELKRIDRLVEFPDEVWVLDYKLGAAENAARYRPQMAEYRVAMQAIYVTQKVRCALLYADGTLLEIT